MHPTHTLPGPRPVSPAARRSPCHAHATVPRTSRRAPFVGALAVCGLLIALTPAVAQLPADTTDPQRILRAARDRDGGQRVSAQMRMTIREAGAAERVRTMRTWALRFEGGVRTLAVFESPADIREMGLLTVDHFDATRDDEQWLYMPAMRRTTRISTASRSGAFAGSDFSFADFTLPDPERYDARLVRSGEQVGDERTWHIELTPREARTQRETGYTRLELWIGQRSLLALRTKAYTSRSGVVKYVQVAGVRQVSGVWMPQQVVARTLRGETLLSETVLEQVSVNVGDSSVNERLFTPARLERGL